MGTREIPRGAWVAFLAQFSREHRAWLATVERVIPGSPAEAIGPAERPLASVVAEGPPGNIAGIEIGFQEARPPVRVDAPATIRVEETAEGVARGLEIVDERGVCTRLRFRAAPLPETLDGIAPGELPPA